MAFKLQFTLTARDQLNALEKAHSDKLNKIRRTLGFLETNPRHPSLNTHKYDGYAGPSGEQIFEAYVENRTPGAYRVFFFYPAPPKPQSTAKGVKVPQPTQHISTIVVAAITPHP